ncbi:DUF637 domain-containing protein [Pseudomonas urethralis]|uniref:DUF637 domain-containing protein n=1 Tax=Pseudomonas urethralis TaxID=2740517 RepID=UPI001F332F40|nr:DUF637 domain-containing protein [Pseudomonas urethralis]
MAGFSLQAGVTGVASGGTQTVIKGGSLGDNLMQSLVSQAGSVVAAVAFNSVGSYALEQQIKAEGLGDSTGAAFWREGGEGRIALHALTGGAISAATGGDFTTGAVAAGANQAMANVLDQTFKSQPALRQAFSQLVGAAAAGLAGGDVNSGAWIAQMADQYSRQAHPDETRLIKKEAQALADAAGISPAEAEQRMAQAFAYYTDRQWQEVLTKQGLVIDAVTMDYLARALTPMASDYDAAQAVGDVPVAEGASKQYTPEQTLALLKGYASNHSGYFNDNKMYGEYLLAGKENEDYYNRNLNFGKLDPNAQVLGAGKGIADSVVEQIKGLYGLGEGLVTNPEGTTTGVLHELIKSASNPQDVVKAFLQAEQNADIQARLFRLQGEPGKAAEVEAKWATDFVSTFVAVNGAAKLGQVAESLMKRESAARVAAEGSSGAKGGAVSSGAENAALYPKLKDQLIQENLSNIAAQDSRLAAAVNGSGTRNPNFSIGTGSAAEADSLGQIWVGDGARPISGVPGGLISADGARVYRPPTAKPNAPAQYNPTGVQANFQTLQDGKVVGNGQLSVTN